MADAKEKVLFSWSGGKDSAFALHELVKSQKYEIVSLLTAVTEEFERVSMHGVRQTLLEEQARSLGFPLETLPVSRNGSNEEFEAAMEQVLRRYKSAGASTVVFGDIFLEDLRRYREDNLARVGMRGIFPLWKRGTDELSRDFLALGFRAVVTCIDSLSLERVFAGREYDGQFLADLPESVDPCGENGEFHSFVYDGPLFRHPVMHERGEVVMRDERFYFCDLVPVAGQGART